MKSEWEAQWESMTIDELFELRELMQNVLIEKLKARKAEIEQRLQISISRRTMSGRQSLAIRSPPS